MNPVWFPGIATALCVFGASADVESAWLGHEGHLVILTRAPDVLRGFDTVTVETRRAQPDGAWRTIESWDPMTPSEREWYERRGELELYRHDLGARLKERRAELIGRGFAELLTVPVVVPDSCEFGECAPAALRAGEIRLPAARLIADVMATATTSRLTVTLAETGASVEIGQIEPPSVELTSGRKIRLDLARVGAAAVTPDGAWVVLSVDTVVPIHAEIPPARLVFAVSADVIIDALGLPETAFDLEELERPDDPAEGET